MCIGCVGERLELESLLSEFGRAGHIGDEEGTWGGLRLGLVPIA